MNPIEVDWHHGDCLDILPTLADASVDAVITDPPYPEIDRDYGRMTESDWHKMMRSVVVECRRILKPKGSAVFILQPNFRKIGSMRLWLWEFVLWAGKEWNIVQDAYWWNISALPCAGCKTDEGMLRASVKMAVWLGPANCYRDQISILWEESAKNAAFRSQMRFQRFKQKSGRVVNEGKGRMSAFLKGGATPFNLMPCPGAASTGRIGQQSGTPDGIINTWIKYICPIGGVVCDPFMGSGATGRAAIHLGRSFVGIEKFRKNYDLASQILSAEIVGLSHVDHD